MNMNMISSVEWISSNMSLNGLNPERFFSVSTMFSDTLHILTYMIHMEVSWSFLKCGVPHFIIHFSTLNQRTWGSPLTIIVYGSPRPARITGHPRYPSHRRWLLRCMWPNSSGTSSALGVAKVLWACGNTRTKQVQRISGWVQKKQNGTKGSEQQIRQLRLRALGNQKMFAKSSIKHAGMFWLDLAHDRDVFFRLCKGSHTHTHPWQTTLPDLGRSVGPHWFCVGNAFVFHIIAFLVGGVALGFGWVCWGEVTGSI